MKAELNLILSCVNSISTDIKNIKTDIEMIRRDLNEHQSRQVELDEDLLTHARANLARTTKVLRKLRDE